MEPLKEMFGVSYYQNLTKVLSSVYKPFKTESFLREVTHNLESRSLNERMRHTAQVLQIHLPSDYERSLCILKDTIPLLSQGYTALVFPEFVSLFGQEQYTTSLEALKYFTRFGSSEFAIRTFLKQDVEGTLKVMYAWSEDENVHVRRLASEGSRPRLPWSFKLDTIIQKPALTKPILDNLRTDEELYVRKSVANHLNDQTKDAPAYVIDLIKSWDTSHPLTAWIVKRGCRSLLKQGDRRSMDIFNLTKNAKVVVKNFSIPRKTIRLNQTLEFEFVLVSKKLTSQRLMIDYRIHYCKKSGVQLPKVFKLKEVILGAGEELTFTKKQRFMDFTTRKLYSGTHRIELIVNGVVVAKKEFEFRR